MEKYTHWYLDPLKKYAVFEGRATRQEYWMFVLSNFIVSIFVGIVAGIIQFEPLSSLYTLVLIIPSVAIMIRRLHDTNRSGWWALLILVPIIGWIALLVFLIESSRPSLQSHTEDIDNQKIKEQTPPASATEEKQTEVLQEEKVIEASPQEMTPDTIVPEIKAGTPQEKI